MTAVWGLAFPILQPAAPAQLIASTILRVLGRKVSEYAFVDFASGAGGPTPIIERRLNEELIASGSEPAQFLLTDLYPHPTAWEKLAAKSDNLDFVEGTVNATTAANLAAEQLGKKEFRTFHLAFHHFDDDIATEVLENTLKSSDGIGIFELQDRTANGFFTVTLLGPLMFLITPIYFWRSFIHMFFTYVIPIVPIVLVVDGYTSCLRTRTKDEIVSLVKDESLLEGWTFKEGSELHTWPCGYTHWVIGIKE